MELICSRIPLQAPKCYQNLPHQSLHNSFFSPPTPSPHTHLSPPTANKRRNPKFTLYCRRSEYFEPQQPRFNSRPQPPSVDSFSPQPLSPPGGRVFVGYSIYKGKAALTIEPKAPEFTSLESGAYKVSKEGVVLLQFAPAIGTRQYDWTRKQVFSLSVAEVGTLVGLGARDSCEFFHDPNKGKSEEGKVRKVLKAEPLPDGTGHFFNLSVQNKLLNVDESIYIPISKGEFTVIVSSFKFILPFLLGWHAFADSIKPEESVRFANSRTGADNEWSR